MKNGGNFFKTLLTKHSCNNKIRAQVNKPTLKRLSQLVAINKEREEKRIFMKNKQIIAETKA